MVCPTAGTLGNRAAPTGWQHLDLHREFDFSDGHCQIIVELHHGRLRVEGQPEQSYVFVELPRPATEEAMLD